MQQMYSANPDYGQQQGGGYGGQGVCMCLVRPWVQIMHDMFGTAFSRQEIV